METVNIILLVLGLAIMITCMVIAVKIPQPTVFQLWVFRVVLALGAASFGSIIPGIIEIDIKWLDAGVRAAGAVGLFVLVYLRNPPAEVTEFAKSNK